jgi:hypothetical protein
MKLGNNKFKYFLNIFEANFSIKYKCIHRNKNGWITQGIKVSCEHKRRLCIHSRDSNDAVIKAFYIKYCKILNKVIQQAKRQHYNRPIAKSDKIKMTSLIINDEKIKDPEKVSDVFNSFFLSIAENVNLYQVGKEDPISFLKDAFPSKFHGTKIVPNSEAETRSIILSIK